MLRIDQPVSALSFEPFILCAPYLTPNEIAKVASLSRHFFCSVAKAIYLAPPYAQQLGERVRSRYPSDVREVINVCKTAPERLSLQCKRWLNAKPFLLDDPALNRERALNVIQYLEATAYAHLVRIRQNPTEALEILQDGDEPREVAFLQAAKTRTLQDLFWISEAILEVDNALSEEGAGDDLLHDFQSWYDLMFEPQFSREEFLSQIKHLMDDEQAREYLRYVRNLVLSWQHGSREEFRHKVARALVPLNDVINRHSVDQMPSHLESLLLRLSADIIFSRDADQRQYECQTGFALHLYKVQLFQSMIQKYHLDAKKLDACWYWRLPDFTPYLQLKSADGIEGDELKQLGKDVQRANVRSFLLEEVQSSDHSLLVMHPLRGSLMKDVYECVLALDEVAENHPLRRAFGGEHPVQDRGPISFGAAVLCLVYGRIFEPRL